MAGLKLRWGGSWINPANIKLRASGSWANPSKVYVRSGGSWVQVWPTASALSGSLSPTSINRTVSLGSVSVGIAATGSGGTGSYTYSWSLVANTGGFSLSGAGSSVCTVSKTGMVVGVTYTCTARCTISDGVNSVTLDCPISVHRET